MNAITNLVSTTRLKAVAAFLTTLVGLLTTILTYAKLSGSAAQYVSGAVAILTVVVSYVAVYQTTNAPAAPEAPTQAVPPVTPLIP